VSRLKSLTMSLLFVFASLLAVAAPAQAATDLGGVSVWSGCNAQWPGSETALIANNVYGWKCRFWSTLGPVYFDVDLSKQCKAQYNNTKAYAAYNDYNNPYSWRCRRP